MQRPTIGRIVHFYKEHPVDEGCESDPKAAIITKVNGGDYVNLEIFDYDGQGNSMFRMNILRSSLPEPDCWVWPAKV